MKRPHAVAIVGNSGAGKTTLLERLIPALKGKGFRGSSLPKIEVHRKAFRSALICRGERNDPALAAVASDEPLDLDVPVLDLNDPGAVAEFIASLASGIGRK